ncbi:MAG: MBOAT family protein, partial [Cyanobacteria bacterium J06588_5]
MIQPSILYGLFLVALVALYWSAPSKKIRLWVLLISSIIFYASLPTAQYVPLMLVLVYLNFVLGKVLGTPLDWRIPNEAWQYAQADWNRKRTRLLALGVVLNVVLLLGFKYVSPGLAFLGFDGLVTGPVASWVMPLGLSFFTFECIAYLVDVY